MKSFISIFLFVLFCYCGLSNAQNKMSLGAGLIISLPMGDFGDAANTGFGGTAAFEMEFTPQIVGNGQIGYISWGTDVDGVSFSSVPLLAGIKYYFVPGSWFYGLGQIGLSFMSAEASVSFGGQTYGGSASNTDFAVVLGAGYEIPVSPTFTLDFTGAFNLISDANHITIRAGGKAAL